MKNLTFIALITFTLISAMGQNASVKPKVVSKTTNTINNEPNSLYEPKMVVFPNPVSSTLYAEVYVYTSTRVTFKVIDCIGRKIISTSIELHEGANTIPIELKGFINGFYFIKVEDGHSLNLCQWFTKQ